MRRDIKRGWIGVAILLAVLAAIAAAIVLTVYFLGDRPFELAENSMPEGGVLELTTLTDGSLELTWPTGENTDFYLIEIFPEGSDQPIFSAVAETERSCILPALDGARYTLRVQSGKRYELWGQKDLVRFGDRALEVTGVFTPPAPAAVEWQVNSTRRTVDVLISMEENETCRVALTMDGAEAPADRELTVGQTTYAYGPGGDLPLLEHGKEYHIHCAVRRVSAGLIFQGPMVDSSVFTREDLLGTKLAVTCQDLENNRYLVTWNETKGEKYVVQMRMVGEEDWRTVAEVPREGERQYVTGYLPQNTSYEFQVLAMGGQTMPGSEYAAEPGYTQAVTGFSPVGSTVWPVQDLKVYDTPERDNVIGTAPQATAYCVLDREQGLFRVRYGGGYGYIDSDYCLINLPEFLGDLCQYDIVNSYSALYMVHEYAIPQVTDTVINGYEHVKLADGSFLVPLLYPAAQKLEQAARLAQREGYILKIYDAYRPRKATNAIYDLTGEVYGDPLPEKSFTGETPEGVTAGMTYRALMTDGRYDLSDFLAANGSTHNLGIAMDLTLVSLETGEELKMQTRMHDLSWYSELQQNSQSAGLLAILMDAAGFGDLRSEWWHFQDNDARADLGLSNFMYEGVTAECWMYDSEGWKYRQTDGTYLTSQTATINGEEYTFDDNGYAINAAASGS